ncbi:CLUMA_CG004716, isoform A, partial [Clunio marinus]
MTYFAMVMTAPTTTQSTTTSVNKDTLENPSLTSAIVASTTEVEPIIVKASQKNASNVMDGEKLNSTNEMLPSPLALSSEIIDTIPKGDGNKDDNLMKEKSYTTTMSTTSNDNLIGAKLLTEVTILKSNETSSPPPPQMPSSIEKKNKTKFFEFTTIIPTPMATNNENKSINSDEILLENETKPDVSTVSTTVAFNDTPEATTLTTTTIEMPIKVDADNSKIMENERDFPERTTIEGKKGKLKENKKKAMKTGNDKKHKMKQKLLTEINHSTIVPTTNEPRNLELNEVTSIKTAPTTIKSTTLTTIKSFEMLETENVTQPVEVSTAVTTTESAVNVNSATTSTMNSEESHHRNDNVIVLNTNSSGLIVVDIMEGFGLENSSNTETFEIKMDLIDDVTTTEEARTDKSQIMNEMQIILRDDIFLTTVETPTSSIDGRRQSSSAIDSTPSLTTTNDDIILINENADTTTTSSESSNVNRIKWNQVKSDGDIKITFDNIDLPNQKVNVSIENGELVIDSIDISVLNKAEEEMKKKNNFNMSSSSSTKLNKTADSLEIILIEDDSRQEYEKPKESLANQENDENNLQITSTETNERLQATTILFEQPPPPPPPSSSLSSTAQKLGDHLRKIEMSGSDDEDGIKIKTTDKDSDTIFYISNTEVKMIESIPTSSPNVSSGKKYYPAIYEEDVIVDVPNKNHTNVATAGDKYEEDIVLSPLTSDFDPKDINYIGEAFLDVEESSQNGVSVSENRHIIPLTSDVVIQPVQLRDSPPIGIPIIGELPPQIELEEMVFSDDYENKQQSTFHVEEFYPNFLSNRLVKNQLEADVPREVIFDGKNSTLLPNRTTHITINTMINGTNVTALTSPFSNATAYLSLENDDNENADLNDIQTLLLACFATLMPLFLCVIIVLTIRYCWLKHRRQGSSGDMMSDKSTDPLAEKTVASSVDELKPSESGMTLDRGGDMQASTELLLAANGDITPTNHSGTNGSIITMTLKNNHLIVETEERNDISRDTRETKMHYSPSDKDGVFIVESARGADQNGSHKPSPLLQKPTEVPLVIPDEIKIDTLQSHFTPSSPEEEHKQPKPEQVEVHTPPAELKEDLIRKEPEPVVICNGTKTGLSQSDLSLTSSNSSNQNYTYGDKESYQYEEKGYKGSSPKRIINVHCHDLKPLIENSPPTQNDDHNNKAIITSAILKNDSPIDDDDHNTPNSDNVMNDENCNDAIIPPPYTKLDCNGELNMDSLSFLPAPPEELSNEQNILELTSMDSLPPPPPEMTELTQS